MGDVEENSDSDLESQDDRGASTIVPSLTAEPIFAHTAGSTTVANHAIEKLVIENNIFLKAALQLLDQRDNSLDDSSKAFHDGSSSDVIMCGALMRCQ